MVIIKNTSKVRSEYKTKKRERRIELKLEIKITRLQKIKSAVLFKRMKEEVLCKSTWYGFN